MLGDPFYGFVLGVLAVWRLSHFFVFEDGPFNVVVRLRVMAGHSQLGRVMDCFYCASLWLSLPLVFVLADEILESIVLWLAISGGASLLWRISGKD